MIKLIPHLPRGHFLLCAHTNDNEGCPSGRPPAAQEPVDPFEARIPVLQRFIRVSAHFAVSILSNLAGLRPGQPPAGIFFCVRTQRIMFAHTNKSPAGTHTNENDPLKVAHFRCPLTQTGIPAARPNN